jgi:hypothetical protein
MRESPRHRRLRSDLRAMQQLKADSTILDFTAHGLVRDEPPDGYLVSFRGPGLWRPDGADVVLVREYHQVSIQLGAGYPRMIPEISWRTPIFHPNISANGVVCLGGYSMHWVPSLQLGELCSLLWDMVRYQNYDVDSAYNRTAAKWARDQSTFRFPLDSRPLADRLVSVTAVALGPGAESRPELACLTAAPSPSASSPVYREPAAPPTVEILYLDDEVSDADIVEAEAIEKVARPATAEVLFFQ